MNAEIYKKRLIPQDDCLIYPTKERYATVYIDGKIWKLHRYVYTEHYGRIPKGLEVRHKCDNSRCCNSDHLLVGTHKDNMNDAKERKRFNPARLFGENHGGYRITPKMVIEIKNRHTKGLSQRVIAKEFKISQVSVSHVINGKGRFK